MNKVYVVTRGDYSAYGIEAIFTNREAAEKYCAVHTNTYEDGPMIEEWGISDGSEIKCKKVYRAIFFSMDYSCRLCNIVMKYSTKPFTLDICEDRHEDDWTIRGISGYIPVNKTFDDTKAAEKIIFDHLAKWKAEQAGL